MVFGERQESSQRLYGVTGVVLLHVLVVYALVTGLARKVIEVLPAPIETKILQEINTPKEPPPPPPPTFKEPPPPYIPPPEINIATAPAERSNAITAVTTQKPVEAPPPVAHEAVRVAPVVDAKRGCAEPEYPASSQRLGESGTVVLQFLIGLDGRVKDSRIARSSGFPRLDEAARDALGSCRFVPGTVDGKPEESWAPIKYTWKLN
ncbi:MAG: energy transducer TonB [Nevskia sp.]|nr:energy transducer TonB [Nevskia sp.]